MAKSAPWSQLGINGLVAGLLTVHAQYKAIRAQREDALSTERREVNGILQSIEEELKEIHRWLGSLKEISEVRNRKGQADEPLNIAAVNQNLFIIFDSNAAALGRIATEELRQNIVRFYTRTKVLVDLVNQNNAQFAVGIAS